MITTQVIIIGAGPTGLSLGIQLLRFNIDFILIDEKAGTTTLSKAIAVQARTLEIFREIGLADKAIQEGRVTTDLRLFYNGKQRAFVDLTNLGEGLSHFPFVLSLEQSKTERLLAEYLLENGKEVAWNTTLIDFQQNDKTVTVHCKNKDGSQQEIAAEYLVGCDGAGSKVRHKLNLLFQGSTVAKLFYVADVVLKSPVVNLDSLFMFMIKKGFALFFPMEGSCHYRIVGNLPNVDKTTNTGSFEDVQAIFQSQIIVPVKVETVRWFSTYKVHTRKANAFAKGRCF